MSELPSNPFVDEDGRIDLAALREAAENDGETETAVYIGGPPWALLLPLLDVVDAARAVSFTVMPPLPKRPVGEWYRVMDRLLVLTERFTNFGDVPK